MDSRAYFYALIHNTLLCIISDAETARYKLYVDFPTVQMGVITVYDTTASWQHFGAPAKRHLGPLHTRGWP